MAKSKKNPDQLAAPRPPEVTPEQKAIMALKPCVNSAAVIESFQAPLLGQGADMNLLMAGLRGTFEQVRDGDLQTMERMLVAQATSLQTVFASLARRASLQENLRHYEAFMGLALKAQSQSRATISALVDLKYPRQATFVKQANIAHGAQQVNNGAAPDASIARAEENPSEQNKLLEADHVQPHGGLDSGAQGAPTRGHQTVEALVEVHRADQPRG